MENANALSPSYKLILHKSYYDKGFFNLGVGVERYVRSTSGPAILVVDRTGKEFSVNVDRGVNLNGSPRIMGGVELRNYFQQHFRQGDWVEIRVVAPDKFVLLQPNEQSNSGE